MPSAWRDAAAAGDSVPALIDARAAARPPARTLASAPRINQYPRGDVNRAYGRMVEYRKRFFDADLEDNKALRACLAAQPAKHGIPADAAAP